jgi:hypothetical protein
LNGFGFFQVRIQGFSVGFRISGFGFSGFGFSFSGWMVWDFSGMGFRG